jgi:hypothetical protein
MNVGVTSWKDLIGLEGGWIGLFAKPEIHKLEFAKVKCLTGSSGGLDRKFRSGGPELSVQTFRTPGALNELRNQSESSWDFRSKWYHTLLEVVDENVELLKAWHHTKS